MITVVAKSVLKDGKTEEFKNLTKELIEETRKEKGCIEYILYEDIENEGTFTFIEKWEDIDCLKAHFESAHFKKLGPQLGELRKSRDLNFYKEA
ncbi:putative quinol monooxygenase [uncultured Ilyobacter sp.]|uniref:putative quinol monooxygenase n=1 Tax=uncultured Ilyobacter sp. TaxID=544433 RepID=UPI0029C96DE9|nr:putative quinol monooxygenase [uncultured Ilyobacter sp.]